MNANDLKPEFKKVLDHLHKELSSIRTGRATPALLDDVMVEAYGSAMPIKGVGTISVPDARTLQIEPWDKNLLKDIEKAVLASGLGINPVVDSSSVRLAMPKLTEENRRELVKFMGKKLEEARVAVRGVRERARAAVIAAEEAKKMSEDERFRFQEELDRLVQQQNDEIKQIGVKKEQEIMTV